MEKTEIEEIIIKSEDELNVLIERLAPLLDQTQILTFTGQLGSGKTTCIKALLKAVFQIENVSSPTYSIINIYNPQVEGRYKTIAHMDLYRLLSSDEVLDTGIEEYLNDPSCLNIIEWPALILPFLKSYVSVEIESSEKGRRIFIVSLVESE